MTEPSEIKIDQVLHFTIASRDVRGRIVRLDKVLDAIISTHNYPPLIADLLAEAISLTAVIGSTLKNEDGQMTIQAQSNEGIVSLLVCDYIAGAVRGYAKFDKQKLDARTDDSLASMFADGFLAITIDRAKEGRYQGIVPLDGASLTQSVEHYFEQSEQLPTKIIFGMNENKTAGALLVQHLPDGEQGKERLHVRLDHPEWEHVKILSQTMSGAELSDATIPLEELAWRLFHEEEVRIEHGAMISKGCRCNEAHIRDVIGKFPLEERNDMANDDGQIIVDCKFCSKDFFISLASMSN